MSRKKQLNWLDYLIIFIMLILAFIPDPTDTIDVGLPIIEPLMAYIYYRWRSEGKIL